MLQISLRKRDEEELVQSASCTCKVGLGGHCGHVCAVLYQLAHYKMQGLKAIPTDVAKTSLPMTFHAPRGPQIPSKKVEDIKAKSHAGKEIEEKDRRCCSSTLYNAVSGPMPDLTCLANQFKQLDPSIGIIPALETPAPSQVLSRFGQVAKGSVLGMQQQLESSYVINIFDNVEFPPLPYQNCMVIEYSFVLNQCETIEFESIHITADESSQFQELTMSQSDDPLWYKLRANRITASKVGSIKSRRGNFEKLVESIKSTRKVSTKAMLRGIECEPLAAACYSQQNAVNLLPCGVLISPFCSWLAASPDRRVYYPSRHPHIFGLLEIKCPAVKSVLEVQGGSLKRDPDTGKLSLNRNHMHYYQILMQLAVSGLPWCDYFVWTEADYHQETINFDANEWQNLKNKVDSFYFEYFI